MPILTAKTRRSHAPSIALKEVALKIMRRRFASAAFDEIGMHQRVQQAGHASHAHITNLRETFVHEGHVCLAFDLHGRDLSHTIKRGKMPLNEVKTITRQLLSALQAMHESGVIHTDLKPGNILYHRRSRTARLSDLGLSETSLEVGEAVATQDYAPPEALLGAPMGTAVDMWALGCIVFEMLTGELLFDPWTACVDKYREFSDDGEDNVEDDNQIESDDDTPSRKKLDRTEEKREQLPAGGIVGGKYQLVRKLGQGKFATVWKAVPLHERPIVMPSKQEAVEQARALRAELPPLPKRARWDLYEVAECYEHLLQMHELLGPAPTDLMQGCWNKLFCAGTTQLRFSPDITPRPLIPRFTAHLAQGEAHAVATFLEGLLRYAPEQRLTADEALKLAWLNDA